MTLSAEFSDGHIALGRDGETFDVHPFWLRDNCPCALCRHPQTNQRLITVLSLDPATIPAELSVAGDDLQVVWHPDGHKSTYSSSWWDEIIAGEPGERVLWDSGLSVDDVRVQHGAPNESALVADLLFSHGVALVRGIGSERGSVLTYAERIGYVRETNYGRLFDVEAVADPEHLAYTGVALALHTDNPYRRPVPGLQLLHCLESSAEGGETVLLDGFRAATELCAIDGPAFEVLTKLPASFRYRDSVCDLREKVPLIRVNEDGLLHAIHFNDRSMAPLELSCEDITVFYAAYRAFAERIASQRLRLELRLEPGDILLFDNERVLHGRKAFSLATGRRHLQGCYADRDAYGSYRRRHRIG
ncbi:MAG: gamma-butyrobetaine dioxygenase [Myxococcota bacterium]|jgi:gamma-butyrobetaine dioxygenase